MALPQLPGAVALGNPAGGRFGAITGQLARNADLALAIGVLFILALLIVPLPPFFLDFLLALNITASILILMISVYLRHPLEISSFPTILLITTLFRLGLNISSTRLILGEAHAGEIIKAFGSFVVAGNFVVGFIIFIILVVINFVVIIKGSSRIAEVTARFTLDALPGKQMSIDADLNAGFIDEKEARERRSKLTQESEFHGAMDGASKFVKGDAVAGLIITGINIIGGFIIGVAQKGMPAAEALSTYTILTIGEGLVSQIPALLISVAAGLVVTRGASGNSLEGELGNQFGGKPRAMFIVSGALVMMALMPGFPMLPFMLLATAAGGIAYVKTQTIKQEDAEKLRTEMAGSAPAEPIKPEDQPVEDLLRIDPVEVELGYGLIPLVDEAQGGDVFKRITNIRRQLATEMGIIIPPVRVRDNLQLEPEEYVIKVRGNEIARNRLYPGMLLAMNPGGADGEMSGMKVTEPVFGLPATWIPNSERENAEIMGFTVVESPTVLSTHLTELLRKSADKMLTRQDVKQLMENLKKDYPALVEEASPDILPTGIMQKVLQNLLKEGLPIRDLAMIIESLLEYTKVTKNVDVLTEYVRHNLGETIKKIYQDHHGVIHAISIDPQLEHTMTTALQTNQQAASSPTLGLAPDTLRNLQKSLSEAIDDITLAGHSPVIICSAPVRPYLYRMIRTTFPMVSVISFTELPSDTEVEIITNVRA
ncbi:MAG TPA: flagellar biosynthesis protein FlhA [Patescibacteria group bacterium]|nr:flagellar biosynthesis protein FlhA [Patescibacteria group bacterium]